jgi:hypothetical protein
MYLLLLLRHVLDVVACDRPGLISLFHSPLQQSSFPILSELGYQDSESTAGLVVFMASRDTIGGGRKRAEEVEGASTERGVTAFGRVELEFLGFNPSLKDSKLPVRAELIVVEI